MPGQKQALDHARANWDAPSSPTVQDHLSAETSDFASSRRAADTHHAAMTGVYARWAGMYDLIYRQMLRPGQKAAIAAGLTSGTDILEVGVGTGLALEHYPAEATVSGIDLSPEMLQRARERGVAKNLTHVKQLDIMDACKLRFPDAHFDAVLAQYMLTLVPDAVQALNEFARVTRPGGAIVIVSHLGASDGLVAKIEARLAKVMRKIGWSSDFKLARITDWAEQSGYARFEWVHSMAPAGFFKVVKLVRTDKPYITP